MSFIYSYTRWIERLVLLVLVMPLILLVLFYCCSVRIYGSKSEANDSREMVWEASVKIIMWIKRKMRHLIHRKKVLTKEETTWGAPPYACWDISRHLESGGDGAAAAADGDMFRWFWHNNGAASFRIFTVWDGIFAHFRPSTFVSLFQFFFLLASFPFFVWLTSSRRIASRIIYRKFIRKMFIFQVDTYRQAPSMCVLISTSINICTNSQDLQCSYASHRVPFVCGVHPQP